MLSFASEASGAAALAVRESVRRRAGERRDRK